MLCRVILSPAQVSPSSPPAAVCLACRRDYNLLRAPQEIRLKLTLPAGPSDASAPASSSGRGGVAGGPGANIRPPAEYTSAGGAGAPSEPQLRDVAPQVYLFNKSLPPPEVRGYQPQPQAGSAWLAL